jgi:AcrR family transcriptional regulator
MRITDTSEDAELSATSGDGRRERWAGHRVQRRALLVQAGIEAVDAHGPAPTIDEVAAAAGVSRPVLYRYFADVEELYQAIADAMSAEVIEQLVAPMSEFATARDIIVGIVDALAGWVELHPRRYQLLRQRSVAAAGNQRSGQDVESAADRIQATVAEQLGQLLELFMTAFGMHVPTAELAARALTGMVENAVHWWSVSGVSSGFQRAELVQELTISAWAVIAAHLAIAGIELGLDDPLVLPDQAVTD